MLSTTLYFNELVDDLLEECKLAARASALHEGTAMLHYGKVCYINGKLLEMGINVFDEDDDYYMEEAEEYIDLLHLNIDLGKILVAF